MTSVYKYKLTFHVGPKGTDKDESLILSAYNASDAVYQSAVEMAAKGYASEFCKLLRIEPAVEDYQEN